MCICAFHQVPFVFIYFYIYFASLLTYFSSHSRLIPFIPSIHFFIYSYICVKCECIARAKSMYIKNKNWKNECFIQYLTFLSEWTRQSVYKPLEFHLLKMGFEIIIVMLGSILKFLQLNFYFLRIVRKMFFVRKTSESV